MASLSTRARPLIKVSLWLAGSLALSTTSPGQDIQSEVPPGHFASFLLDNYELVATGRFADIPEQVASDYSETAPTNVLLTLNLSRLYEGYVANNSILVQVPADMLQYPGEDFTRYRKRRLVFERLANEFTEIERQLGDLQWAYENGAVSSQEFQEEQAALLDHQADLVAEIGRIPSRQIGAVGFETFYDLGGMIQASEEYLVGLNRSRDNPSVFILDEIPAIPSIFWGRLRDDLASALDEISGEP